MNTFIVMSAQLSNIIFITFHGKGAAKAKVPRASGSRQSHTDASRGH